MKIITWIVPDMKRDYTFDIARALCMLYIIGLWHMQGYVETFSLQPYGECITQAVLGLFMFISAYFLGMKYPEIHTGKQWISFFNNRIVRILPLYVVALALFVLGGTISLKTALLASCGLSTFFAPQPPTLWFVAMILMFYLIFPILSGRNRITQLIIAILILSVFFVLRIHFGLIDSRFFFYFPCFVLGVMASAIDKNQWINYKTFIISGVLFFLFCWVFVSGQINGKFTAMKLFLQYGLSFLISISGSLSILYLSAWLSKSHRIVKVAEPIAYASMVAYMFHRQIISVIRRYIFWPEIGVERLLFLFLVCLPTILLFGYFVQKGYDKLILCINKKQ